MTHHISTIVFTLLGLFSFYLLVISYQQARTARSLGMRTSRLAWSRIDTTDSSPDFAKKVLRTNVLITLNIIVFAKVIAAFHIFG